jgi:hypothetical protein
MEITSRDNLLHHIPAVREHGSNRVSGPETLHGIVSHVDFLNADDIWLSYMSVFARAGGFATLHG